MEWRFGHAERRRNTNQFKQRPIEPPPLLSNHTIEKEGKCERIGGDGRGGGGGGGVVRFIRKKYEKSYEPSKV